MDAYENPIDVWIVESSGWLVTFFREGLGLTPNGVTVLSIIFSLIAIFFLWRGALVTFVLFSMLAYWMDDLDGVMARKYKLTSKAGELLDHLSDAFYFLGVYLVLVLRYGALRKMPVVMVLFLLSALVPAAQYACASRACGNDDDKHSAVGLLSRILCPDDLSQNQCIASSLRYFGGATYQVFMYAATVLVAVACWERKTMGRSYRSLSLY